MMRELQRWTFALQRMLLRAPVFEVYKKLGLKPHRFKVTSDNRRDLRVGVKSKSTSRRKSRHNSKSKNKSKG